MNDAEHCRTRRGDENDSNPDAAVASTPRAFASLLNERLLVQEVPYGYLRTVLDRRHRPPLDTKNNTSWYGTIFEMEINRDEAVPLYVQVAAAIRRAIAEGEITQGERLPPVVDLAAVLGVNKNTVIRAMHQLRDDGLLDFTRGRGIRVVGTPQRSALLARISQLLEYARSLGHRVDDVVSLMRSI